MRQISTNVNLRQRHGHVEGRCACEIIYGSPERQKKSYLKDYLAAIKRLML